MTGRRSLRLMIWGARYGHAVGTAFLEGNKLYAPPAQSACPACQIRTGCEGERANGGRRRRTYAGHGVVVGQHWEGVGELYALDGAPDPADEVLGDVADLAAANAPRGGRCMGIGGLAPGNEGHFEIDLGKFRLSVLPAVLVAEALCDLEVAVDAAGADEHLLWLLGRLCERIYEGGGVRGGAGGDEELAGTLGGRAQEGRGLDLCKIWAMTD